MDSQIASLAPLINVQVPVNVTRYLSGAGFVILLFEWTHGFPDEVRLMWKRPMTFSRAIFLYFRYGVLAAHAFITYGLSGQASSLSKKYCNAWLIIATVGGVVTLLMANAVTLRRFYITWDYRRRVTYILHAAFIISSAVSVGFLIPSIRDLYGNIEPENELYHACLITQKPVMWVGIWTPQVAFGLFVVGFTLYNVGERPRTVDVKLIKRLQRDGAVYFVALFGLRLINFVFAILNTPNYIVMIFYFDWAMVAVVITRLMVRLEDLTLPRSKRMHGMSTEERHEARDDAIPLQLYRARGN